LLRASSYHATHRLLRDRKDGREGISGEIKGPTKHRVIATVLSTTWWHSTNENGR